MQAHLSKAFKHNSTTAIHCALRKYGVDSFSFNVVEEWSNKDTLAEREKYWIKMLNSKAPFGYNLTDGGDGSSGAIVSEATRAKHSSNMKERTSKNLEYYSNLAKEFWKNKEYRDKVLPSLIKTGKANAKAVCQYDLEGNIVAVYPSQTAAALATGIGSKLINAVSRGRKRTAGGFIWKDSN